MQPAIYIVPFVCNFAPFFSQTRIYTSSSSFNLAATCIRAQDGECHVSEVTLLHVKTYTVVGKIDNLSITRHSVHCSHYVYVQQLMISYFLVQSSAQTSLDFLHDTAKQINNLILSQFSIRYARQFVLTFCAACWSCCRQTHIVAVVQ